MFAALAKTKPPMSSRVRLAIICTIAATDLLVELGLNLNVVDHSYPTNTFTHQNLNLISAFRMLKALARDRCCTDAARALWYTDTLPAPRISYSQVL